MKKLFMLLIVCVATRVVIFSQTRSLSVEKAIETGLENSKTLHASQMRVKYADAKASEAEALRLPTLKFNAAYSRLSDIPPFAISLPPQLGGQSFTLAPTIVNNYVLRATVEQPLFTGFRLSSAANAAEYSSKASEEEHVKAKSDLVYNIRLAYWSLFKAIEIKKVNDENVEQVRAHSKDVQSMVNQGMATTNDQLKVQVQLSDAQLRQIEANNNVQLAMIGLNNTIAIPLNTQIELSSTINMGDDQKPQELSSLIEKANTDRPELKALQFRMMAAEEGITAAKSGWWPQVYLAANYNYNRPNQRLQPAQDIFKDTWDVTLGLSLDIWNWGKTLHQTDQAGAQYEEVKDVMNKAKDDIALEITATYLNLSQARAKISVAREGVAQAEENYRVTGKRFKEGLAQNTDLLDAEGSLLIARTNYTNALVDFELAEARLQKAIGG